MSALHTLRHRRLAGAAVLSLLAGGMVAGPAGAVELVPEALAFSSAAPSDAEVGGAPYEPLTTGGLVDVDVFVTSATPAVCAYDADQDGFVFATSGTCVVTADQLDADGVALTEQAVQSFDVAEAPVPPAAEPEPTPTSPAAPRESSEPAAEAAPSPSTTSADAGPGLTVDVTSDEGPNEAGWYHTPVVVSFTCSAGSAPLVGDCPKDFSRLNTEPDYAVQKTVTDTVGRTASVDLPLKVDSAGPELTIDFTGADLWLADALPLRCSAVDGRAGLVGPCAIAYGDPEVGSDGVLRREWAVAATDHAGNTSLKSGFFRGI